MRNRRHTREPSPSGDRQRRKARGGQGLAGSGCGSGARPPREQPWAGVHPMEPRNSPRITHAFYHILKNEDISLHPQPLPGPDSTQAVLPQYTCCHHSRTTLTAREQREARCFCPALGPLLRSARPQDLAPPQGPTASRSSPTHRRPREVGQGDPKEPAPGSPDEQGWDEDPSRHGEPIGPAGQEEVDQCEQAQGQGVVGA